MWWLSFFFKDELAEVGMVEIIFNINESVLLRTFHTFKKKVYATSSGVVVKACTNGKLI